MPTAEPGHVPTLSTGFICDLSPFGIIRIEGEDALGFLQGQLSNDVRRLSTGGWQHTTYNSPKGRVLANFMLWLDGDAYRALLPAELLEPVRKRLAMFVLRSKVTLVDDTAVFRRWGRAGPGATDAVRAALGDAPAAGAVLRTPRGHALGLAADRYIILGPEDAADALEAVLAQDAQRAGFDTWAWLQIRAGVPAITAATQDLFILQTANLDVLGGVSFDKGCYTGQEIVARMQYLGRLKERLYAWHAEVAVATGDRLFSPVFGEQACGTVVNVAHDPQGGRDLLAVMQVAAAEAGEVRVGGLDGPTLTPLPLPYAVPAAVAPPRRLA
ncbi:MAG: folate-binding protein [Casimicrobiaceae bacterium]